MNPEQQVSPSSVSLQARQAGGWEKFNGGLRVRLWPIMNVYDQNDPAESLLTVDPNYCVGCAIANAYQAVTRKVGKFAKALYEQAKQSSPQGADDPGARISLVANVATARFGGTSHRLTSLNDVLSWVMIKGPVVIGLRWTQGMEFTHGRGRWWQRIFGPRWMSRGGYLHGYHCVAIMGTSSNSGGYVVIENSRGLHWGSKGTARLSWADLESLIANGDAEPWGFDFPQS